MKLIETAAMLTAARSTADPKRPMTTVSTTPVVAVAACARTIGQASARTCERVSRGGAAITRRGRSGGDPSAPEKTGSRPEEQGQQESGGLPEDNQSRARRVRPVADVQADRGGHDPDRRCDQDETGESIGEELRGRGRRHEHV